MSISESDVKYLFDDLCAEQGFCLSPKMNSRLAKFPPKTSEKFADAIIRAEGLNPQTIENSLYTKVLSKVEKTFYKYE